MLRSHSLPWQLRWLPDPSWSIPALHQSKLGIGDGEQPGTHWDTTAIPGWGLGSGISQARQPGHSQRSKGLGAASSSGQEGLGGAGIAPKPGSDLSMSVLLDHPVSPRPLLCDPGAAGETGIPCAAGVCPISGAGKQEESIRCCAQAQQELAGHWHGLGRVGVCSGQG